MRRFGLQSWLIAAGFLSPVAGEPQAAPAAGDRDAHIRSSRKSTSADSESRELLDLQNRIRREAAAMQQDRLSMQDRLAEVAGEKRAAGRLRAALEKRRDGIREEIGKKNAAIAAKAKELEAKKALAREIRGQLEEFLEQTKAQVQSGIPWKVESRLESIRQIQALVKDEKTNLAAAMAAAGRIQQEEESLGRLVETANLKIRLGSREIAVNGFHLGLLGVVFANEDGSIVGFARAGQKLEDGIGGVEAKLEYARAGYLLAVDILNRRRSPGIADVYLPAFEDRPLSEPKAGGE